MGAKLGNRVRHRRFSKSLGTVIDTEPDLSSSDCQIWIKIKWDNSIDHWEMKEDVEVLNN